MLDMTRLRFPKEVIRYPMSQNACELFLRDPGFLRELLESGSCLEGHKVLNVVFENTLQADRCGKLSGST